MSDTKMNSNRNSYCLLYRNTLDGNVKLALVIDWFCKKHNELFNDNHIRNLDGEVNFNYAQNELWITHDKEHFEYRKTTFHYHEFINITDTPIMDLWRKYGDTEKPPSIIELISKQKTFNL